MLSMRKEEVYDDEQASSDYEQIVDLIARVQW